MSDLYYVVVNDEEQYSIWSEGLKMPLGWRAVGEPQPREECLQYIDRIWTDICPRSARG